MIYNIIIFGYLDILYENMYTGAYIVNCLHF